MLLSTATTIASALVAKQVIKMMCQPRKTVEHFQAEPIPYKDLMRSAIISRLAYEEPGSFRTSVDRVCSSSAAKDAIRSILPSRDDDIHFYDAFHKTAGVEDTQAYMWRNGEDVFIAFRGTEDKTDAMADIDVRTCRVSFSESTSTPAMRIHRGFYEQTDVVIDDMIADFEKLADKDGSKVKSIHIQGHSLGASCASIAALVFSSKYPNIPVKLHTYGSPRVGDSKFSSKVEESIAECWRVYNVEDPVPMIPISFRFEHIGRNSLCLAAGKFDNSHEVYEHDLHWALRPIVSFGCINLLKPIAAHDCELYIHKLESLHTGGH
jgi:hypothetical protein